MLRSRRPVLIRRDSQMIGAPNMPMNRLKNCSPIPRTDMIHTTKTANAISPSAPLITKPTRRVCTGGHGMPTTARAAERLYRLCRASALPALARSGR